MSSLRAADLRFINRIASLRCAETQPGPVEEADLDAALTEVTGTTPFVRAASLAAALMRGRVFPTAPYQTTLLALHCALALDRLALLAPQGVVAGMIRGLDTGGDVDAVARWLEDRTVPAASG